jgi:2-succinyl-6-hydroxy-2,4-cyclohexadiene-1-carboxylate synthase
MWLVFLVEGKPCTGGDMSLGATTIPGVLPYFEIHDGPAGGPHLLLLHGFLSSRAQWRPNLAGLQQFCRPVVVELFGHGRSPAPDDPNAYAVDSYLESFEEIRRRIDAERWVVCGQSFGAGLVIQYALRHPERVPGLIFTNSLSAMLAKGNPEREAQQQQRIDAIRKDGRAGLESIRIHPRHAKRLPEDAKRELVADAARISLDGVIHSWQTTSPQLSVIDVIGALPMPALLVNGVWEKRFQPMRDAAARRLPSLTIVDLDGGHSINMEAAEGFNAAVRAFLSELPDNGA